MRRLASTDICLLMLGASFLAGAQAADNAPATVIPPKPVILQPTAVMAPPPPVPAGVEDAPKPAAKARPAKVVKQQKPVKPAGKPRPKARRH